MSTKSTASLASEPNRSTLLLLYVIGLGVFIGTLDQTAVVTILPDMIKDLQLPVARFGEATWIVNGYLLGYAVAMLLVGHLADVFGHLRVYLLALGILVAGSAAVAVAPTFGLLVAARTLQAIGGGGVLPVAMAIAASILPPARRPVAFGALAAANNASSLLGPLWGAAIASAIGWRGVFWLNIPLILPMLFVLPRWLHERDPQPQRSLDWLGVVLSTFGLAALTFALTDDGANPRPLPLSLASGVAGLLVVALFLRHELNCARPMIRLSGLTTPRLAAAMAIYFLIGGALITALVDVPLMSDTLLGQSTITGGLALMRLLLLLPIGGVLGGFLCIRAGYRLTTAFGLLLAIAGFVAMRFWPSLPSDLQLWWSLGLVGFGLGLCDGPIVSTVVDQAASVERAAASALLLILWTCGMITGLALLGTQSLGSFDRRAAQLFREQGVNLPPVAIQHLMRQSFNETFLAAAAALVVALALALFLDQRRAKDVHWSPIAELSR